MIPSPSSRPWLFRAITAALLAMALAPTSTAQTVELPPDVSKRGSAPTPVKNPTTTWTFDETSTGNDIQWTSPTAVNPNARSYSTTFTLTTIEVSVSFLGIPFGSFDVTDQLPPDQLTNSTLLAGPSPISVLNSAVVAPPPPEPIALGATLLVGLNAAGNGSVSATNVVLGTVDVDLGAPFGFVTAQITGVRIVGSVTVTPLRWFTLPL